MIVGAAVAQNVFFYIIAAMMVFCAVRMVTNKNIVHSALYLVAVLAGVAGIYLLLAAEFIAIVQVLIYLGAIIVLFLFGIMLTRSPMEGDLEFDKKQIAMGLVVALPLAGLLGWALWDTFEDTELNAAAVQRTSEVGDSIFGQYLVPFEALSMLLLAALIGAVVLARKD
jgi:NADH-quinone oxidoreductase subunit J